MIFLLDYRKPFDLALLVFTESYVLTNIRSSSVRRSSCINILLFIITTNWQTSNDSLLIDKEAAFWDIYDQLEEEQKNGSNHMEIDKTTVSGQELKQRLVSSGRFYTSHAHMMIVEMVGKGELEQVSYDTYARVYNKIEMNEELCWKKKYPLVV